MAVKKWVSLSKLQRAFSNLANKRLDTLEEIRANTSPAMLAGAATVKELDSSLSVPVDGAKYYADKKDGKYGVNTDPNRGADTFIPFNSAELKTIDVTFSYNTDFVVTFPDVPVYFIAIAGGVGGFYYNNAQIFGYGTTITKISNTKYSLRFMTDAGIGTIYYA